MISLRFSVVAGTIAVIGKLFAQNRDSFFSNNDVSEKLRKMLKIQPNRGD
jgi:hypothetical protein